MELSQECQKLKQTIWNKMEKLQEPRNYMVDGVGTVPDEPSKILFLRRDSTQKINFAVDADKLYHRRYVITINLHTDGLICINEKTFPIPENYAALVYPYQTHHYLVDQNRFHWLVVTFELQRSNLVPNLMYRSVALSEWAFRTLLFTLDSYLKLLDKPDRQRAFQLQRTFANLLLELGLSVERIDAENHLPPINSKVRLFEQINGYIYQKLDDPLLSVEKIADKHSISVSALYLIFNNMTGCNPGEYIRNLRIQQAQKLLDTQDILISDVANRTGFSSLPIFSRCFHHIVGLSPRDYQLKKQLANS